MNINITISPSLLTFVSEGILPLDQSQTYINILTGIMLELPEESISFPLSLDSGWKIEAILFLIQGKPYWH